MTAAILFSLLFILVISAIIFFIMEILLPAMNVQRDKEDPLYSKEKIEIQTGEPEFKKIETGMKAVVLCSPERKFDEKRFNYKGTKDCTLFSEIYKSEYDCLFSCVGFGNCVNVCSRQSISIVKGTAVIGESCNGCGICVSSCPKQLIKLIPVNETKCVLCKASSDEKTSCSMLSKETDLSKNHKKDFEFWKKCYNIIHLIKKD